MTAALMPVPAKSNRTRNEVMDRLSHELRTPLNSVIGFSRVLQGNRAGNQRPADLAMLEAIRVNGERLLGLMEDLVALSVAPELDQRLTVAPTVDVACIAEDVIARWMEAAAAKKLVVALDVEGRSEWRADPTTLMRLLDKLIGNAVKFTGYGGVFVSILGRDDGARLPARIEVADTGIGIPPERLNAVFEPFVQVEDSASRSYEGAGLGLPVARSLAGSMGCSLRVESEPGKGTRFVVEFPM